MPAGHLEFGEIALRLGVAACLGGVLGIEEKSIKSPPGCER